MSSVVESGLESHRPRPNFHHFRVAHDPGVVEIPTGAVSPQRLCSVLGPRGWARLDAALKAGSERLRGRTLWMVNSTSVGGGVAELLRTFVPYWRGAGVDVRWAVIQARPAFFVVTKRIHNFLHGHLGDGGELGTRERGVYERSLTPSAAWLGARVSRGDVVVLHDPQTAGLAPALSKMGARIVLRSHVGADNPSAFVRAARDFLARYVSAADAMVFTRRPSGPLPYRDLPAVSIIPPCVDPCATKNREMQESSARGILARVGIAQSREGSSPRVAFLRDDGSRGSISNRYSVRRAGPPPRPGLDPIVVHLARWDRLKDPVGVMDSFAGPVLDRAPDARLILAGPSVRAVTDDPEAASVYRDVERHWKQLPEAERKHVVLARLPMHDLDENAAVVNALQRQANVVVKKSLEEGFGLGVTEGMWKRRPVVASAVGGHALQIEHDVSGVLVDDPRDLAGFGTAVAELLLDRDRAQRLGQAAHLRVKDRFLPDRHAAQWVRLIQTLL